MSKDKLTDYDATAANNTDVGGISVDEGMLPSNVNNAIREVMSHLKDFAAGTQGVTAIGVDTISETTADNGVVVDSVTLKDGEVGTTSSPVTINLTSINGGQIGGRRNLIINGAMNVAQRGTQTSQTSGYTACDRFQFVENGASVVTTSQDTDVPSGEGFSNSLKIDVTNANPTVSSGNYALLRTKFEGQDLQHLLYGTSSAKTLTLSFWVKSPKTGTHVVELHHTDAGYHNSIAYTVNSANTWENKVVTFDGYQTTAFDNDAERSLQVYWWLMAGSDNAGGTLTDNTWTNTAANQAAGQVNVMDSTSNEFYITGVQLEVGSVATEFEHRSYGEELALCRRYYYRFLTSSYQFICNVSALDGSNYIGTIPLQTPLRVSPAVSDGGGNVFANESSNFDPPWSVQYFLGNTHLGLVTTNKGTPPTYGVLRGGRSSSISYIAFDAEL